MPAQCQPSVGTPLYAEQVLTLRDLNRTLLRRQHLLERTEMPAADMVEHLLGLQAQENLPPYLSLAARTEVFDPSELSAAIETGELVRLLTLRTTIHLHSPDDALAIRSWVQPALDRMSKANVNSRPAQPVPTAELVRATRRVLADGPVPVKQLGERLAEVFPDVPAIALAHAARERMPLVQMPPRGMWRRQGGVVYQTVQNHVGRDGAEADVRDLVRRYLRAFGPATARDMTVWSGMTRLGPVFTSMAEEHELDVVECEDGRRRYDAPGAPYADGDTPAPVRLLGSYDNLWLSHSDREHIAPEAVRRLWMGRNGGVGNVVFVDGLMAGVWWWRDGQVVTDLARGLTRAERAGLRDEVDRVTALLSR